MLSRLSHYFSVFPSSSATGDGHRWEFLATLGITFKLDLRSFSIVIEMVSDGYDEEEPSSEIKAATYRIYRELSLRSLDIPNTPMTRTLAISSRTYPSFQTPILHVMYRIL